jgi:peptidoglycan/xylan/chitin deacetylase (PgdA/CDA1 family)
LKRILVLAGALLALAAGSAAAALTPRERPVPILMYHVIAKPPAGSPFPGLYVRPGEFRSEMAWLARNGYRAVTLDAVYRAWHGLGALPRKPIVLTFDDGYRSQFAAALPILRSHHWPGDLNLLVRNLRPVWGLRPRLVRSLIRAGWEIDAHTIHHLDLTKLSAADAWSEIEGSRFAIQDRFNVPVYFFCYPSGRFDAAVVGDVRRAGFLGATTELPGLARPSSNPFELPRVRISAGTGVRGLASLLRSVGLR